MKKVVLTLFALSCCQISNAQEGKNYKLITNPNGIVLGYNPASGVKILTVDGLKFKDLNKNGKLDKYEDWRLNPEERAKDLARQMTIGQISGLMLYSGHQMIPASDSGFGSATYNGLVFSKGKAKAEDLSDNQKKFLKEDNLRHTY
ncbi:hypothetical protein [Pedobacter sp. NJ-S-72]